MTFREYADKCATLGYSLGLSPDQFWSMIPTDFVEYVRAKSKSIVEQNKRDNERTALICATIANSMRSKKGGRVFKIDDFMPKERVVMTDQQMLKKVEQLNALFGGTDKRKRGD